VPKSPLKGRAFHANRLPRPPNRVDRRHSSGPAPYIFRKLHAGKFPWSTPERKSSWQGITETWMTGRPNAASLWGTLIRQCITMPPKLHHSRLAKLSLPRLLAARQRLDVIDKKIGPALLPIRADLSEGVAELKPQQNQCIGWPPSARLHAVGLRADHPAHTARPTGIDLWRVGAWRVGAGVGLRSRQGPGARVDLRTRRTVGAWRVGAGVGLRSRQGPGARVDLRTRRTVGAGVGLRGSRDLRVDLWRPGGAGVMIGMRRAVRAPAATAILAAPYRAACCSRR
jgi:hypothetical protein